NLSPASSSAAVGVEPVPGTVLLEPFGLFSSAVSVEVEPGLADLVPAVGQVALFSAVHPLVSVVLRPAHNDFAVVDSSVNSIDSPSDIRSNNAIFIAYRSNRSMVNLVVRRRILTVVDINDILSLSNSLVQSGNLSSIVVIAVLDRIQSGLTRGD